MALDPSDRIDPLLGRVRGQDVLERLREHLASGSEGIAEGQALGHRLSAQRISVSEASSSATYYQLEIQASEEPKRSPEALAQFVLGEGAWRAEGSDPPVFRIRA